MWRTFFGCIDARQSTAIITSKTRTAKANGTTAQSIAVAVPWTARDGTIGASKTMVAQTFSLIGTRSINASHWASIGTTVWTHKTIVALALTVNAITVAGAHHQRIVRGTLADIARHSTPAGHTCALTVVANTVSVAVFWAVPLPTIFTHVTDVALALHVDARTTVRT